MLCDNPDKMAAGYFKRVVVKRKRRVEKAHHVKKEER